MAGRARPAPPGGRPFVTGGGPSTLEARLRRAIRHSGPIAFAHYMALALGDRRDGYYAGADRPDPLGADGDFTTAPEISQMFGELIGAWCADLWRRLGAPDPVRLVELGPGRGTLMADLLRAAAAAPEFRRALEVHLVETGPAQRRAQRAALGPAAPVWHDTLATVPDGPMLLVANEFFDALPVHRFAAGGEGWRECLVGLDDGGGLALRRAPGPTPATRVLAALGRAPRPGAVAEVSLAALALAGEVARRVAAGPGAALVVDYGGGGGASLHGVRRHRRHPPLAAPGLADLSARVDFDALAQAARDAGAAVFGPVGQGAFLAALGLGARAAALKRAAPDAAESIDSAVARLASPDGMGTRFQALALGAPGGPEPAGFAT